MVLHFKGYFHVTASSIYRVHFLKSITGSKFGSNGITEWSFKRGPKTPLLGIFSWFLGKMEVLVFKNYPSWTSSTHVQMDCLVYTKTNTNANTNKGYPIYKHTNSNSPWPSPSNLSVTKLRGSENSRS